MSGTLPIYSTADLIGVQQRPDNQPDNFWLTFFTREYTSQAETILFDDLGDRDRRLAPFVAPMAQGRVMRDKGFITKSFKPAYLKPKHVVDPSKAIKRRAGERLTGELTLEQRWDAVIADNMLAERSMIERRWDWMAARALIDGAVTVSGDDYPEQYVDFDRHSTLSYLLTSTARWGESAADPLGDIRAARKNAFERGGYPVQDLIFGSDAWDKFTADVDVKALLSTQTRGSTSDWRAPVMNDGSPFAFEGTIGNANIGSGGQIRLWTYSNFYEETLGGNRVNYLDTNTVVGIGNPMGVRAFGAIMDADAGLAALPMFPKMWKNMDPSVNYTMTASAPLMVPMNPNSTFKIKVY
jgi:hypothetical protein